MSKKLLAFLVFQLSFQILFYYGLSGPSFFFYILAWGLVFFLTRKPGYHPRSHLFLFSALFVSAWEATHLRSGTTEFNYFSASLLLAFTWASYHNETGSLVPNIFKLGIDKLVISVEKYKKVPFVPILFGLLATIVVTSILATGDTLFNQKVKAITDLISADWWERLAGFVAASVPLLISLYAYFRKINLEKNITQFILDLQNLLAQSASWASIFLTGILGIFIYTSLNYILTKLDPRLPGFTYSAYVTQGFVELIVASLLTLIIAQLGQNLFSKILSLLTLGLLALNFHKLQLYMAENGLTQIRVLGFWFLLWLAILLLIQIINKKRVLGLAVMLSIIFLVLANLIDTDRIILTSFPPKVNGQIDNYYQINNFGLKTLPSWPTIFAKNQTIIQPYLQLDPTKITFDQYYAFYWANQENQAIANQIERLANKYGTNSEIFQVLSWNQNYDNYSDEQRIIYNNLANNQDITQHQRRTLSLPANTWLYQNQQEKNLYDPKLLNLYQDIQALNQKTIAFEKKIPENQLFDLNSRVWDRKN